jgi:hypothetical protein
VELFARLASGLDQRLLTPRNPDLGVTSIDQRESTDVRPFAGLKSGGEVRPIAAIRFR